MRQEDELTGKPAVPEEADVFLSHNSADKPAVEEIARRLEREGLRCWLDKWDLVPGEPWQEAIEEALEHSRTCAVFLGPSGLGPWENEEMRAALVRRVSDSRSQPDRRSRFRVIPVVLPGAPDKVEVPPFLGLLTWVRFGASLDDEDAFHRLLSGIRGIAPGAGPDGAPASEIPYRGLEVFDVQHAPLFFGREAWTERLLRKIEESGQRFLAILGPSGSGKSSLARAGVLAALRQGGLDGSSGWLQVVSRPGAEPLLNLALALNRERPAGDPYLQVTSLSRGMLGDPAALHIAARLRLQDAPDGARLVLLIDQLEELFTHPVPEDQRRAFLDSLAHAARVKDGPTLVVLTLRAEFYGHLAGYPIADLLSEHQTLLGPMAPDDLRKAIESPALRVGCELEPGLTDLLLRDVEGQPAGLPLLEFALLELWERRTSRRLTVETYREIGGVEGALRRRAEQVDASFPADERETLVRPLLLQLAQPDEGEGYSRRRARRDEILDASGDRSRGETVLNRLADARLIVTEGNEDGAWVEIAHEALLREWPRLRGWLDERREMLLLRSELSAAAGRWADKSRDASYLFTGARLAAVEAWAASGEMSLGALEQDFLAANLEFRAQSAQAELKRVKNEKLRRRFAITLLLLIPIALFFGARSVVTQRRLDVEETLARARNLSAQSIIALTSFPQRGLLLAYEAVNLAEVAGQPHFPPAEEALRRALSQSWGHPFQAAGPSLAAISTDQRNLATAGEDGVVRLWGLAHSSGTQNPFAQLPGPKKRVRDLIFSPSNHWLVAHYEGDELWIWDLRNLRGQARAFRVQLSGSPEPVFHSYRFLAFSPDDEWIATKNSGESLRVWKPEAPHTPIWVGDPSDKVKVADLGSQGWLAVGHADGTVTIWKLSASDTSQPSFTLPSTTTGQLGDLVFRPSGAELSLMVADEIGPALAWSSQGKITPMRFGDCARSPSLSSPW